MLPPPAAVPDYSDVNRARFEADIVPAGRPAVLRGLVGDWPAVRAATTSDDDLAAYLRRFANTTPAETWVGAPEIAGRFDFTAGVDAFNYERKLATVDQLLDLLLRQRGAEAPFALYAGAMPTERHLPGFRAAHPMPLLSADRDMLVSLWLGNRTRTATHWDLPQNLACVVAGRRRFTLFPTDQVANLYVGPLDFTLAGQPSSLVDVDAPDLDRFPKFATAWAQAQVAELGPGDALYIPSLWWHSVRGTAELGAMVNFWWRDGPEHLTTPLLALLHTLLLVKDLPANERDAWRVMFDHYAFGADGDPAAHLPDGARGILGEHTSVLVAGVRDRLKRSLS